MKSGRQDTGRQYIPRKPVTIGWEPDLPTIRRGIVSIRSPGRAQPGKLQSNRAVILSGLNFILSMHKLPKSGAAKLTPCVASMKQRTR